MITNHWPVQLNSDIMEININALEGLQLVADSIAIPDQSFKILNESLFEIILSGEDALVQESMLGRLKYVCVIISKMFTNTL